MNLFAHRILRTVLGVLLLGLAAAGCRTYGGYGTEAETLDQIEQANNQFAEEYQRAQRDLAALERGVASHPALRHFAEAYAAALEAHEAVLDAHRAMAERAVAHRDNYRQLNRTYGAVISDQQIIRDRYEEVLADMRQSVTGTPPEPVPVESRYQVAPQFYQRIGYAVERRSLSDILASAGADGGGAAPSGEAPAEAE